MARVELKGVYTTGKTHILFGPRSPVLDLAKKLRETFPTHIRWALIRILCH